MNETTSAVVNERNRLIEKIVTLFFILTPVIGVLLAVYQAWGSYVSFFDLVLLLTFYMITGLGITVGFHRLFTHQSFDARPWVRCAFGIFGAMAIQGRLIEWCGRHADHHHQSDRPGDPHSPLKYGEGAWAVLKGFFFAHIGWIISVRQPEENSCTRRLREDSVALFIDRHIILWGAIGFLVPALLGALFSGTWQGAWRGFLWGGLVRMFVVQHVTWAVNSYCHIFGKKYFKTGDNSRNSFIFAFLAFGEGNHDCHHAFQSSAQHGLFWWQPDLSFRTIQILEKLRLVWNVKRPSLAQIQAKKVSV